VGGFPTFAGAGSGDEVAPLADDRARAIGKPANFGQRKLPVICWVSSKKLRLRAVLMPQSVGIL
jgi:hypothetical protein